MKLIPLTKDYFAKVDDEDYEELSKHKWCSSTRTKPYAVRRGKNRAGMNLILMHRAVTKCPDNMIVDHIDGDGLNNQKSNLRICTQKENMKNQRPQSGRSSKYKGVCWCKNRNKWHVKVKMNNKYYNVGRFDNERDAAMAYNAKASQLFGEYANLNVID